MSRTVTLVLVDADGALLGALPPFDVAFPFWPEVSDVVAEARSRYGVDVAVLRLLWTERPAMPGGAVTYLAQLEKGAPAGLRPVEVDLAPHPLRAPYAEPGGPDATLRWAADVLGGPVVAAQQRTWNLSAIWRLDHPAGPVWLKQVPWFFRHEATVLGWLGDTVPAVAPTLLAAGTEGRMLLDHIPGEDCYDAPVERRDAMAALLHGVQEQAADAADDLVGRGVPDLRGPCLTSRLRDVCATDGAGIDGLDALAAGLADRMAAVTRCGLPDTLVHGDFHPGNVRAATAGGAPRILDWGDAFVGNPAFDALRMTDDLTAADAAPLLRAWAARWRATVPGSDPETALDLLRPAAELRNAAVYADFVARIEPAERPFHAADVARCLRAAVARSVSPVDARPHR